MKLKLPLKDILVTQYFGDNYVDFYQKLGMKGHNGIDFYHKRGANIFSAHAGTITFAGKDGDGGISVQISNTTNGQGFKTIYYHLKDVEVKIGQKVRAGILIGHGDNTGKYTTGDHLHFGLKMTNHGHTNNKNNGYNGAIDPAPYFKKDWDKSNAYHRYGRPREYWAEFRMRFKNKWLHRQLIKKRQLKKIYDNEFINALVYGGWDFESVINPSIRINWGWQKKQDFLKGNKTFT